MIRPQWKWEWNLNTIVILMGFAAGLAAWGGTWARLTDGQANNRDSIARLDKRLTAMETMPRLLDNHEFRIGNLEKQATDSASTMRDIQSSLNAVSSDVRVMRELLQRIDAAQNGHTTDRR